MSTIKEATACHQITSGKHCNCAWMKLPVITPELTTRNTAMEAGRDSECLWRDVPGGIEHREWRIEDCGSSAALRRYSNGRNDSCFDRV
jgi:hypothetical protein